ncbi:DUF2169 domain-containing protein [Marinospirillum sp.]|uniref:DUF2169 domain-containing protein n=1 Tax=Marinospirillum sp. TaxID=2183934 RepID=UPI0028709F65|nr:DUF2169 domain-containing protein [Marinospirillum sp.]MDR9467436.1 DUF2169 domain-containing protein [Marinospirillum sp.]
MQIIKPLQLSLLNRSFTYQRRFYLSLGAVYGFELSSGTSLLEQDVWEKIAECEELQMLDAALPKHQAEYLVYGCAETSGLKPQEELLVDIQVGDLQKSLQVQGAGFWQGPPGFKQQRVEEPFSRLPLSARYSFGGSGFAENLEGQGHQKVKTPEGEERYPITQLQLLEDPATEPGKPVRLAFTAAQDLMAPQRQQYAGTYDEAYQTHVMPGLPDDFDFRFCQDALPDQRFDSQYLPTNLSYSLQHLNAEHPQLKGQVPYWQVMAWYLQKESDQQEPQVRHLKLQPETLLLLPNQDLGLVLYRGQLLVERDDARDISALMVTLEDPQAPKSKDHYQDQLYKRSDQKNAWRYLLDTQPLLPDQLTCGMVLLMEQTGEAPNIDLPIKEKAEHLAEQALEEQKKEWQEFQEQLPDLQVQATPAPDWQKELEALLEKILPKKPDGSLDIAKIDFDSFDELTELNKKILAEQKQQALDTALPQLESLLADSSLVAQHPQIREQIDRLLNPTLPPWPRPDLQASIEAIDDELMRLDKEFSEVKSILSIERLETLTEQLDASRIHLESTKGQLLEAEEKIKQGYRMGAEHLEGGTPVRNEEERSRLQQEVLHAVRQGQALPTDDLSNMDFTGMQLDGADFSNCYMEGVQLKDASLHQANLQGVILVHAHLEGTDFTQACLDEANLGANQIQNCRFVKASMKKVNFNRSNLQGIDFTGAVMDESQWMTTQVNDCNFAHTSLQKLNLIEPEWRECHFKEANLSQGNLLNARFTDCSFEKLTAEGTNFVELIAENSSFQQGQLNNVRFVGGCQLTGCDFSQASLKMASFREAKVSGGNFDRANLEQADLELGDFKGASFYRSNLFRANLANVDFTRTYLEDANLMEASLYHARVVQADLRGANLYAANFLYMEYGETRFDFANLDRTLLQDWRPSP